MTAYLDISTPLPYCPGCGHAHVLHGLDEALSAIPLPANRFALVTDIGCVGLADARFPSLHTVHALHGRAAAIASGMQLAQHADQTQPLKPVVLVGDGGATIGLLHLVHAAQLDVDITVLVHNNLVYGMTGGQHSGLTPDGMPTVTTPQGSPLPPLDLGTILAGASCSFFARIRVPGDDVANVIRQAIEHPGFACVELLELCPTFAARVGRMTGKKLEAMVRDRGLQVGIVHRHEPRSAVRRSAPVETDDPLTKPFVPNPDWGRICRATRLVVAGRAGARVQAAAKLTAIAATIAGLQVTLRTDNPVTQGHGFSLAELSISAEPIDYAALVDPDLVIITAPEGLAELRSRRLFTPKPAASRLVVQAGLTLPDRILGETTDWAGRFGEKSAALGALVEEVDRAAWWRREAWHAAVEQLPASQRGEAQRVLAKVFETS